MSLHVLAFTMTLRCPSKCTRRKKVNQCRRKEANTCARRKSRLGFRTCASALDAKANYPERCALSGTGSWLKNSTRSAAVVVAGSPDKSELLHLCACSACEHSVRASLLHVIDVHGTVSLFFDAYAKPSRALPLRVQALIFGELNVIVSWATSTSARRGRVLGQ
jgi:hypothetical protein